MFKATAQSIPIVSLLNKNNLILNSWIWICLLLLFFFCSNNISIIHECKNVCTFLFAIQFKTPNGINRHTIFLYYLNSHHCIYWITENVQITKKKKNIVKIYNIFFSFSLCTLYHLPVRKCGLFEIYLHILGIYLFYI